MPPRAEALAGICMYVSVWIWIRVSLEGLPCRGVGKKKRGTLNIHHKLSWSRANKRILIE